MGPGQALSWWILDRAATRDTAVPGEWINFAAQTGVRVGGRQAVVRGAAVREGWVSTTPLPRIRNRVWRFPWTNGKCARCPFVREAAKASLVALYRFVMLIARSIDACFFWFYTKGLNGWFEWSFEASRSRANIVIFGGLWTFWIWIFANGSMEVKNDDIGRGIGCWNNEEYI